MNSDEESIKALRNKRWLQYLDFPDNDHDYDNEQTFAELEDVVRRIMLQFPQGVTLRRFLRLLDQNNHYFKDDPERLRALIERMPDLALWISRETRPDIITPVSWRTLKEQHVHQDLRDHRVKALKKGIVPPEVMEIWFQEDVTLKFYE